MFHFIKQSRDLQVNAGRLLYNEGLDDLFSRHGKVLYAGAYALDLMIWKDIDLNIILEKSSSEKVIKSLVSDLLDREDVSRIKVFRDLHQKYGASMPRGVYAGAIIDGWKFDIFLVDAEEGEETANKSESVRELLNEKNREKILFYKNKLLTSAGRSPKFSSVHVYDAILKKGLTKENAVFGYLRENGIQV
jgi:hypothetical protein